MYKVPWNGLLYRLSLPYSVLHNGDYDWSSLPPKNFQDPDVRTFKMVSVPPRVACPMRCRCACHLQRPGFVLVWVPESSALRTRNLSEASDSSDDGSVFHKTLPITADGVDDGGKLGSHWGLKNKMAGSGSCPVRRRSLRSSEYILEGSGVGAEQTKSGVVLTSYKSKSDCTFNGDSDSSPSSSTFIVQEDHEGTLRKYMVNGNVDCTTENNTDCTLLPSRNQKVRSELYSKIGEPLQTEVIAVKIAESSCTLPQPIDDSNPGISFMCNSYEVTNAGSRAKVRKPARRSKVPPLALMATEEKTQCIPPKVPSKPPRGAAPPPPPFERKGSLRRYSAANAEDVEQKDRKESSTSSLPALCREKEDNCVPPEERRYSPLSSGGSPKQGRRSATSHNSLWQELPVVRESGVLEGMTNEEKKMQESMFEVLTSEASYLRSLNVLIEHFMESRELNETLVVRERKILFSNILKVKEVGERFLMDLEDRVDENILITDVCDIIYHHAIHHFPIYIDYVRNQVYQEKTYSELMEKNPQFQVALCRLQELPQCQRLPFMSFLLLPFQRITRIKMLIENILKRTVEGSESEENATKALDSVSKIIQECNREVGRMKQTEELIHMAQKIVFDKIKAIPIISQNRFLEKKGELSEVLQKGSLFGIKPTKLIPVYFFLFNDFLLITQKRSSDKHLVLDYAHRSLVQVQACPTIENSFFLTLLENHQGKTSERLFKAPTQ
ncbi:hypothetical protein GDO86_020546 [Hymenochirus boettgeri]|uniref:DH domain-containing protein n=1 Tax=Hymenochirus boettgeri TaxID=247094 RepID=A0A8T2II76_9PIPI|nr:hypothetical protein GDO86_020546 [Hymenochirus boettgeri]